MKRYIIPFSIGVSVITLFFAHSQGVSRHFLHSVLFERKAQIFGLSRLERSDIINLLPVKRSNLWWYANFAEIKNSLRAHPLIGEVSVGPCQVKHEWGCFEIAIVERTPRFRIDVNGIEWLADEEGALILPTIEAEIARVDSEDLQNFPLLLGVSKYGSSPDETIARIRYMVRSVLSLQTETGRYVRAASLLEGGGLDVYLEGLSFLVRFGNPDRVLPGGGTPIPFLEQVTRLEHVLGKLDPEKKVQVIDLVYQKFVVVR